MSTNDQVREEVRAIAEFVARNPGAQLSDILRGRVLGDRTMHRTAVYRRLSQAQEAKLITMDGGTRAAAYYASPAFLSEIALKAIAEPVASRTKVGYQQRFLDSYNPEREETWYLDADTRKRLMAACGAGLRAKTPERDREMRRFMADLSYNSSRLEGVKAGYADTIRLLDEKMEVEGMSTTEAAILRNHYNAIRFLVDSIEYPPQEHDINLTEFDVRGLHALLSDGLLKNRRLQGQLRYEHLEIKESAYIPLDQPTVIQQNYATILEKARRIADPFEQALFVLVQLPYLQPFEDCNKRTARLACNIPLLRAGLLPVSWMEVNPKDFLDALVTIYEHNSVHAMAKVFTQACLRSFERFEVTQKSREPERVEVRYSQEIKAAVRKQILFDTELVPPSVSPSDVEPFRAHVSQLVADIAVNDMVAVPHRLTPSDVANWLARRAQREDPADESFEERDEEFARPVG